MLEHFWGDVDGGDLRACHRHLDGQLPGSTTQLEHLRSFPDMA
jgi:hypothetical protein